MDPVHEAELARIMERRRQMGRSKAPAPSPPRPASSPAARVVRMSPEVDRSSYLQPQQHPSPYRSRQDQEVLSQQQEILRRQQDMLAQQQRQQQQLEQMRGEVQSSLNDLVRAAKHSAPSPGAESRDHAPSMRLTRDRLDQFRLRPVDSAVTERPRGLSMTTVPIPQRAGQRSIEKRTPATVKFGNVTSVASYPLLDTVQPPRPVPTSARPFALSTVDVDSSVTLLKTGDWFIKWAAGGNKAHPRYLWLDTEKKVLIWARQPHSSTLLHGHIRIEEVQKVHTSQAVDTIDDVPRIFYVLHIYTANKEVRLATEKREKCDTWYSALTNISNYYHSRGLTRYNALISSAD